MAATTGEPRRLDLRRTPVAYPGEPLGASALLLRDCVHSMTPRAGRPLADALVTRCDRCAHVGGERVVTLDEELLGRGAAALDARRAVAAVGSNANVDVLRGKMVRAEVEPVIPLLTARVAHLAVGHSAHVSRPGFVPAAPRREAGAVRDLVVGLYDDEQLAALDATEGNYVRRRLSSADFPVRLEAGLGLRGLDVYASRWGVLGFGGTVLPSSPQPEVAAWLAGHGLSPWLDHEPAAAAAVLAGDTALRERLRRLFVERDLVMPGLP